MIALTKKNNVVAFVTKQRKEDKMSKSQKYRKFLVDLIKDERLEENFRRLFNLICNVAAMSNLFSGNFILTSFVQIERNTINW